MGFNVEENLYFYSEMKTEVCETFPSLFFFFLIDKSDKTFHLSFNNTANIRAAPLFPWDFGSLAFHRFSS